MKPLRHGFAGNRAIDLPPVFDTPQEVKARIDRARRLLLFLDFDGTLAPIVQEPKLALLPTETRVVLDELASRETIRVAIVSGRSLVDITGRVGMPTLIYAGNHGLEIEGPGLSFEHPRAADLEGAVREITERIAAHSASLEGIEIESKGLTSSIHYRRAPRSAQIHLEALLRDIVAPNDPDIVVSEGKMIHEVRPRVAWDKGNAVIWIRQQLDQPDDLPIVMGDDTTDENAFVAFDDAITICVDPRRPTAAEYWVESPDDVKEFLEWIARNWERRSGVGGVTSRGLT
jgi:trehalose 6-phosphate phosphatase